MKKQSFVLFAFLFAYFLIQIHLAPAIMIFIVIMQHKRNVIGNLKQRIGLVPSSPKHKHVIWFHAVSVGEVAAINNLVTQIKQQVPNAFCYITTGTEGGYKTALKNRHADAVSYIPFDFVPSMLLAYHRIKPSAIILVESEIWPGLIMPAKLFDIPLFMINGRVSARSNNFLFTFTWFTRLIFSCFTTIFTQTANDKKRLETLDLAVPIAAAGNIKSLNALVAKEEAAKLLTKSDIELKEKYTILLVGCMHPGEDVIYLDLFKQLKPHLPNLKLLLVPRHFTWKEKLVSHVKEHNISYTMWDESNVLNKAVSQPLATRLADVFNQTDTLLICRLGELFSLYPYATLYFLGGTFVPVGGHNLLDPLSWALPTIVGPFHQNSAVLMGQLMATKSVCLVQTEHDLLHTVRELLDYPQKAITIGQAGHDLIKQEAKSVQKNIDHLIGLITETEK